MATLNAGGGELDLIVGLGFAGVWIYFLLVDILSNVFTATF